MLLSLNHIGMLNTVVHHSLLLFCVLLAFLFCVVIKLSIFASRRGFIFTFFFFGIIC